MSTQECRGRTPDVMEQPMVIAPCTYWIALEERTGSLETTVESLAWWVRENPSHRVEVNGYVIALESGPAALAD